MEPTKPGVVVITGSTGLIGLIGRHLARDLGEDFVVVGLDVIPLTEDARAREAGQEAR